jgi:molybdenum cofactor cytidylyltransferase
LNQLPTVIVLASGRGERFVASGGQGNKLHALLEGKAVLQHTLDTVKASGLPWHLEDAGHPGMGDSIAAGVRAAPLAAGWLILPGDLPLIQPQTLRAVAQALQAGAQAAYPSYQGVRGHPVGFAAENAAQLKDLKGNQGAALILSALFAMKIIVDDVGCVTDIDTLGELEAVRNRMR